MLTWRAIVSPRAVERHAAGLIRSPIFSQATQTLGQKDGSSHVLDCRFHPCKLVTIGAATESALKRFKCLSESASSLDGKAVRLRIETEDAPPLDIAMPAESIPDTVQYLVLLSTGRCY
jgi:hypothetical protein